jgi:hypothetical protein
LNQFRAFDPSSLCIASPGIYRLQVPSRTRNSKQNHEAKPGYRLTCAPIVAFAGEQNIIARCRRRGGAMTQNAFPFSASVRRLQIISKGIFAGSDSMRKYERRFLLPIKGAVKTEIPRHFAANRAK